MLAWAMRYLVLLVLQAPIGGFLLAFGKPLLNHSLPLAAALAAVLVAANALVLALWAGWNRLSAGSRVLLLGGVVVGGLVACVGAGLATHTQAWSLLTLAGTFWNVELANLVATLNPLPQELRIR